MSEITSAKVKELRLQTGAGMMDCKKALSETGGSLEEAVDWLRKKGLSTAAKKSGRVASEGLVSVITEGTKGAVVEVNSETDFVAKNTDFQAFVQNVTKLSMSVDTVEDLSSQAYPGTGRNVADELTHQIATIGENMNIRRLNTLSVSKGSVVSYVHNAEVAGMGKIGVLVALESSADQSVLESLGKQIAMHIAATNPESLDVASLDPAILQREKDILSDQARASGKPEEIIEKMVEGRIRKFYEERVLLEQVFVIDGESKVKSVIEKAAKDSGSDISLVSYARFELGEGIEKKEEDFASEVAATLAG